MNVTANHITCIRFLCCIALLFCPAFSIAFYAIYIVAGLSDILDGWLARKTKTESKFGAKLDSAADFTFIVVCLIKLIPVLNIPNWIYVWMAVIAVIKAINIISGYVMQREFVSVHSVANKVTGLLIFAIPLSLPLFELTYCAAIACAVATFAAIQEGHFIRTR